MNYENGINMYRNLYWTKKENMVDLSGMNYIISLIKNIINENKSTWSKTLGDTIILLQR